MGTGLSLPLGWDLWAATITTVSPAQSLGVTMGRKGWVEDKVARGEEVKASRGQNGQRIIYLNLEITKNFNRSSLSGSEFGAKMRL